MRVVITIKEDENGLELDVQNIETVSPSVVLGMLERSKLIFWNEMQKHKVEPGPEGIDSTEDAQAKPEAVGLGLGGEQNNE